jgi:hypothetical protein
MGDVIFWTLKSIKDVRLSEIRVLGILYSDHLLIMFCILDHIKAREILDPVEKFTGWEQFQSLASALVSPKSGN